MSATNPLTAESVKAKVEELRGMLIDVIVPFAEANSDLPTQAIMLGLGELLLQISVQQVGPEMTQQFFADLQEAARRFGPQVN